MYPRTNKLETRKRLNFRHKISGEHSKGEKVRWSKRLVDFSQWISNVIGNNRQCMER